MKRPMSVPRAGHLVYSQQGLQGRVGGLGHTWRMPPGQGLGLLALCFTLCPAWRSLHQGDAQQGVLASLLELRGSSVLLFATLGGHGPCARPGAWHVPCLPPFILTTPPFCRGEN